MFENGNNGSECGKAYEIPEYIYRELNETSRVELEQHFAECAACSAEFAGMSSAHLAVMQWRDEAFAGLSTPQITIPYPQTQPSSVKDEDLKIGWLDTVRQMVGRSTAFHWGGGLAAIAAVLVVVFIGVSMLLGPDQPALSSSPVVHDTDFPLAVKNVGPDQATLAGSTNEAADHNEPSVDSKLAGAVPPGLKPRSGTNLNRRRVSQSTHVADNGRVPAGKADRLLRKLPGLNDVGDDDDNSLRLAELFDQLGG